MKKIASLILTLVMLAGAVAFADGNSIVVFGINCLIDGKNYLEFTEATSLTAVANLPDGQLIDYWIINGVKDEQYNGQGEITLNVEKSVVIEAIGTYENEMRVEPTATPVPVITEEDAMLMGDDTQATVEAVPTLDDDQDEIDLTTDATETASGLTFDMTGVHVYTIGATMQYLDNSGKGKGDAYTELDFSYPYINPVTGVEGAACVGNFRVTADDPTNSNISYWVIDGVRYDFNVAVKRFTVTGLTHSMTIECVYKGEESVTLGKAGTGECIVKSEGAKMTFINDADASKGGYFKELDFTSVYYDEAKQEDLPGGSVTLRVVAKSKPAAWYFNEAKFQFGTQVEHFVVRGLNTSMVYKTVK